MSTQNNRRPNEPTPEPNMTFEPWMLTASVLGELSPEQAVLVEQTLADDPSLRDELNRIQNSIRKVADALNTVSLPHCETIGLLSTRQRNEIFAAATDSNLTHATSNEKTATPLKKLPLLRRPYVITALATAACVPVVLFTSRAILFQASQSLDHRQPTLAHNVDLPPFIPRTPIQRDLSPAHQNDNVEYAPSTNNTEKATNLATSTGPTDTASITQQQQISGPGLINSSPSASNWNSTYGASSGSMHVPPLQQAPQGYHPFPGSNSASVFESESMMRQSGAAVPLPTSGNESTQIDFMSSGGYPTSRGLTGSDGLAPSRLIAPSEPPQVIGIPPELYSNLKQLPPSYQQPIATGDRFDAIVENSFVEAEKEPITTFSVDVDTASYSLVRRMLQQQGSMPSPDMVRIEELVNYFNYTYGAPAGETPFSAKLDIAPCPWAKGHQLVRVGVQAKKISTENRPRCNLVFLIDVSGSMADANKLPLVQRSLSMLVDRMEEGDRVAIVVYAGAAGMVLESTPGNNKDKIREAIYNLQSGGSTNGGEGIKLAYKLAKENFISGGANRVILCTDGDFNVGLTNPDSLIDLVKEEAKSNTYLTCLGFGQGNYNDSLMERISKDGNGLYGMVDSDREAKKLMVDQVMGTLVTVAKDVKLQMDFNPNLVKSYRLIGYENRQLANADFNNDLKDAGDIGAGHSVTALYEIIPTEAAGGTPVPEQTVSKYTKKKPETTAVQDASSVDIELLKEWLTLGIRYKLPEASESTKLDFVLANEALPADVANSIDTDSAREADVDFKWAASVAEFGLLLRKSKLAPNADWDRLIDTAASAAGSDEHRLECVELIRTAKRLSKRP